MRPPTLVVTGPTASGKSALALAVAARLGGTIINADSMQVYRELAVVTARPTAADEAVCPHVLYGHVPAAHAYSVGRFVIEAAAAIDAAHDARLVPIIVGGTGLYLQALLTGLSAVPPVPPQIRARLRREAAEQPSGALYAELARRDPVMAGRLSAGDTQRVVRALEVLEATGRSLSEWQADTAPAALPLAETIRVALAPPRAELYARGDARIGTMIADGVVAEVEALSSLGLDPALPAMRAVGVPALLGHLGGDRDLETALDAMRRDTRHYVKRQMTWLRRTIFTFDKIFEKQSACNAVSVCTLYRSRLDRWRGTA
jgi:tRNA dimethylallyltransferase